jgi:phosphatidylserine/phosphatidylglycerophosphate/cardiolipin synthase-like enzyme
VIWLVACRGPLDLPPASPPRGTDGETGQIPDPEPRPIDVGPTRAVYDRDFLPAALDALGAAQREVRVAQYLIYEDPAVNELLAAIEDAAARGVRVRFLADQEGDETAGALEDLAAAGVETAFDSPRTTLHAKLIVADDVALVGSHNFTDSALSRNHEGSTLVADSEVAGWYAAWFDALWTSPEEDPQVPPLGRSELVPIADRQVTEAVVACLDGATDRVDLVMYALTWDDRYPGSEVDRALLALEAAHARGVAVRVILDGSPWVLENGVDDAAITRLRAAGVPVWRTGTWVTTHAKALRCDQTTVVGDANWSYSGLALMHGTTLVSTLPALAAAHETFVEDVLIDATPAP